MQIAILDTGCANLLSVRLALRRLGYHATLTCHRDELMSADKLLLPGVGTAQAAMKQLAARKLIDIIKACTQPVLGICLGMQLLARHSMENGGVATLGIIDRPVTLIDSQDLPLPHMGWNKIAPQAGHPLFYGINSDSWFYFVHSYAMPVNSSTIAHCCYGFPFSAAVQQGNFFGVQFHPERSGRAGAQLLKNFLEM